MGFTKDEFLDKLHEHMFGDDELTDEDHDYFDHVAVFFDQFESQGNDNQGNSGNSRRRKTSNNNSGNSNNSNNSPRRKRRVSNDTGGNKTYGNGLFFQ